MIKRLSTLGLVVTSLIGCGDNSIEAEHVIASRPT